MFFKDDTQQAGRSTASMQYKEPAMRVSKTYQDSNIFGYKDTGSMTVTDDAKRTMQRPFTAHKKVINKPSHMNEIFTADDKGAREKLRRAEDGAFHPKFENASASKRYVSEFYGGHHTEGDEGLSTPVKSHNPLSKSVVLTPKSPAQIKFQEYQSNIFSDQSKLQQYQESTELLPRDKLLSTSTKWDSKNTFRKPNNLRKSEDLSNTQLTAFAQNKKKMELQSNIFNAEPAPERNNIDLNARPQEPVKADFKDNKNEDLRKSNHLFSDIFHHDDKKQQSGYKNKKNLELDPFMPTNMAWNDPRTERLSPGKNEAKTAAERKLAHLSGSVESVLGSTLKTPKTQPTNEQQYVSEKALEREMLPTMDAHQKKNFEMKSDILFTDPGQSTRPQTSTAKQPSLTFDFDLKSIPKNMELDNLKKVFSGYHVIDLKADRNQVNGLTSGSGRVKIRANASHDLLKLKHDLKEHGILMLSHFEKHNKKTNYRDLAKIDWHDQQLQKEEGRIKSDFNSAFESKLRNLESEGDIFGNSAGVGKWDRKDIENVSPSKIDDGGREQKTASDLVKTLNWKKSIKNVTNTLKPRSSATTNQATTQTTKGKTSVTQPKKAK